MTRACPRIGLSVCVFWLTLGTAGAAVPAVGVVAGWDRTNGHVLLGELNCVACHAAGAAADRLLTKQSPFLGDVGARVTPQYLRAFLSDPQKVKAGTPMPDLLHALPAGERDETVESLVHYLASLGEPIDQRSSGASRSQIEQGKELYHTAGCVACHGPFAPPPRHKTDPALGVEEDDPSAKKPESPSAPLGELALKTTVEQLAAFLADPLKTRPSGRMPSLHLGPGEARLIAAYLLRDQYTESEKGAGTGLQFSYYEGSWSKVPDFDKLTPKVEGEAKGFDLSAVAKKDGKKPTGNFGVRFRGLIEVARPGRYHFWTHSDDGSVLRIDGEVVVDNDGIHAPQEKAGTVELTKGRHAIEVGFVQGPGGYELAVRWQPPGAKERSPIPAGVLLHEGAAAMVPKGIADFKPEAAKVERGRQLFASLGCAACHPTNRETAPAASVKAPQLTQLNAAAAGGCLDERAAAGRPRFALSDAQRQALRQAVAEVKQPKPLDERARVDHLMTALNCYACHVRDGKGGPDRLRSDYFTYEIVVDLGDEGRLPPPLDGVGAKLTPAGFEDALFSGKRYRSYMAARMPSFGKENVGRLPELLARLDAGKAPPHTPAFSRTMVDDGRRLVGKTALACINCHAWGEYRIQGAEGLDLLQAPRRLQPGWAHAFLLNPQRLKPRTRMPAGWPEGKSFFPDLQGGDTHKQIDAVWAYLSAGAKGGMPAGMSVPGDEGLLVPSDEPIVFRTFLDGVGAHAILVGFPERTHVAFDANRVRTVMAWTGNFIGTKAAWEGRAGQYAKVPSADLVRFPDGPAFARLDTTDAAWPVDPPKAKLGSARTPPGWCYLGYRLDARRVPTFLYRIDAVEVEETPGTDVRPAAAVLLRRFRLSTQEDVPNLYLRVAAGQKIVQNNGIYAVDGRVRCRVAGTDVKPLVRDVSGGQELLVPVRFGPGANGKGREAKLDVEMMW
jgi:mono/diheme cytochrome c family protein